MYGPTQVGVKHYIRKVRYIFGRWFEAVEESLNFKRAFVFSHFSASPVRANRVILKRFISPPQ
jgi:hypothetical protein